MWWEVSLNCQEKNKEVDEEVSCNNWNVIRYWKERLLITTGGIKCQLDTRVQLKSIYQFIDSFLIELFLLPDQKELKNTPGHVLYLIYFSRSGKE